MQEKLKWMTTAALSITDISHLNRGCWRVGSVNLKKELNILLVSLHTTWKRQKRLQKTAQPRWDELMWRVRQGLSSVWLSNISKAARTQRHAQASQTGQSLFVELQVNTYIQKEVKPSLSHFLLVISSTFSCFLLLLTQVNQLLQVPVLFQLFSEHECLTSVDEWCPVYFPLGKAEKQSLLIMSMINSTTARKERWGKGLSYWKR